MLQKQMNSSDLALYSKFHNPQYYSVVVKVAEIIFCEVYISNNEFRSVRSTDIDRRT